MASRPWPRLEDEHEWLIDDFERRLAEDDRSPEELREVASELRQQAADSDIKGVHDASLAMAERYEQAAGARVSAG